MSAGYNLTSPLPGIGAAGPLLLNGEEGDEGTDRILDVADAQGAPLAGVDRRHILFTLISAPLQKKKNYIDALGDIKNDTRYNTTTLRTCFEIQTVVPEVIFEQHEQQQKLKQQ